MSLTRRTFMARGAALAGAGLVPFRAHAEMLLGPLRIDSVSDGHLVLPGSMTLGLMPEEATEIVTRYGLATDSFMPDCNVTLLRDGTNTVLFDVGAGLNFMESAGKLTDSLDAIGVAPEDVTHVVFTHAHPDHLWGVLDDFDEPLFLNAVHMMGRAERDYWLDPETGRTIGEARAFFAAGALRMLSTLGANLVAFDDGEEILPGVAAVASGGHTPGHMAFEIRGGSESLMVIGDAIGNHHVGFERPEWQSGSDQDPEAGAATRSALLDRLAAEKMLLAGFHLPAPGIGRAEKTDDGYRFIPA